MGQLNEQARQNRVSAYADALRAKLATKIIDVSKPEFADLKSSSGKPLLGLNGEILIRRHIGEDGKLKGVISIRLETLASILPDIKAKPDDTRGWKKDTNAWKAEGMDILEGVADPQPEEYELTAMEELKTLDITTISDFEAKQKLIALQGEVKRETTT